MTNTTYKNELIKRKYLDYATHSKGFSPSTIECFEKALWLWEDFSKNTDLANFNKTRAEEFKDWLKNKKKNKSEENLSLSYCYDILRHLKAFFDWLSKQPKYRKIISTDIEYLNLSKGESRIATQSKGKLSPSLDEVKTVIESIEGSTEIEMRDKALISLTFLTGARISAIVSLPMSSFNRQRLTIEQNPKSGVRTKFSKRIVTALIPFSYKEPLDYFLTWINHLEKVKKFKPNDPIFPATKVGINDENLGYFSTNEVEPVFWETASSARKIFEHRFIEAGIDYYHPHTLRHLLVKEIAKLPLTEEQKKAISQNLGHEDVGTTFGSYGYGHIEEDRQIEIVRNIDFTGKKQEVKYLLGNGDLKELAKFLKESEEK